MIDYKGEWCRHYFWLLSSKAHSVRFSANMSTKNLEMGSDGVLPYLLFSFTLLIIFHHCDECSAYGGDTLSLGASLTGNQTIISKNGTFELGFFSPNGTNNWYIGIRYGKVAEKTIVWVANRERPAKNRPGVLKLSKQGSLDLFDAEGASLWSVNMSNKASRAVILDSGNFEVLSGGNKSEIIWQSFDYPSDTWLPGMKLGGKKKLVCWKNSLDPAPGRFSYQMDPSGTKQIVLRWNDSVQYWESGAWDGKSFSQIPEMWLTGMYNYSVEDTSSGFYLSYTFTPVAGYHMLSRFVVHKSGGLQSYVLIVHNQWSMVWSRPGDQCTVYNVCGAYGTCNSYNVEFCRCVEGFIPRDNRSWSLRDWSSTGCVRQSPLNCDAQKCSTDGFIDSRATLPANDAFSYPATTKKDCEKVCLHNCSCTAYAFNMPSGPCQIWSGDLLNMHNSKSESDSNVFIRVAASSLPKSDPPFFSKVYLVFGIFSAVAFALEWLSGLPITHKVDVYSFGMTFLEIISGRRNVDMSVEDSNKHYFPSWVAAQVYHGKMSNIVKEVAAAVEDADTEEMKRAIVVGLLCIEKDENVRPSMGQVVRMLEGKMEPPTPQIPSNGDVIACKN
ncbi:hypothetical protein SUGI_0657450 [Cryptomeria japonica]|nr:hypothetical protein SUGI_0657450 [Cryptomeria japonica]